MPQRTDGSGDIGDRLHKRSCVLLEPVVNAGTRWFRSQDYSKTGLWHGTWEMDAGVFSNQRIYSLDKVQWLAGGVVEVLSATVRPGFHREIEGDTRDRNRC